MRSDLRYACRALLAAPGYALTAIACLALGLGANAAVFAVADTLFFRPPPGVVDAAGLVRVAADRAVQGMAGFTVAGVTPAEAEAIARGGPAPRVTAAFEGTTLAVGRGADARAASVVLAAPGYWDALGARPALGRTFAPDEERASGPIAAIVSHRWWQRTLAGDSAAIGRVIDVNGTRVRVVGVAAAGFNGLDLRPVDLWLPLAHGARLRGERATSAALVLPSLEVVVRLRRGESRVVATGELRALLARAASSSALPPAAPGPRFEAPSVTLADVKGGATASGGDARRLARWLAAVSALVLLVAATNVAGLALARRAARGRELAVRRALGATRGRLVRELVAEAALLVVAGAAGGAAVAYAIGVLLRRFPTLPEPYAPDMRLAAAVLALALLLVVACGLLPALLTTRGGLRGALQATGSAAGATRGRARARELLLVGQLALTLMLASGAALFLRSLSGALAAPLGFDVAPVVAVTLAEGHHRGADRAAGDADALRRMRDRALALPGVRAVSRMVTPVPFTGMTFKEIEVPGAPAGIGDRASTHVVEADEHYLRTLGMRVLRGRALAAADRPAPGRDAAVVLVNETMARRDWPGRDPIGQCVRVRIRTEAGSERRCRTVVGVVGDARTEGIGRAASMLYEPLRTDPGSMPSLLVRLDGPAAARAVGALHRALVAAVPDAPPLRVRTLAELLGPQLAPHRLGATLFTLYGLLALLLAAVGLYGVVAHDVARRRREFAVRTALGALPDDVVRQVAGAGARQALAGTLLGLAGAAASARLLTGVLYGVRPTDPWALAGACAVLAGVTLLASWLPARRAATVEPAAALRVE